MPTMCYASRPQIQVIIEPTSATPLPSGELLISSSDVHLVQPSKCSWTMEGEDASNPEDHDLQEHVVNDGRLMVPTIPRHRPVRTVLEITQWSEEEALVRIDYKSGSFSYSAWHTVILSPKLQCHFDRIENIFRCIMWSTGKGLIDVTETWIVPENENLMRKAAVMQHNVVLSFVIEYLSNLLGPGTSNQPD